MTRTVTLADIHAAHERIRSGIYRSPCTPSVPLSDLTGCRIFCKLDLLQRTGSFKERGARNALETLDAGITTVRDAGGTPQGLKMAVERGLIPVGTVLTDPRRRWTAKVRADGSLIASDAKGSIHSVGAAVQGAPACNGWTFWHMEKKGQLVPIDLFRQQVRAELAQAG